jgi:glycosyltransferase involved in cell wall biosynthesis
MMASSGRLPRRLLFVVRSSGGGSLINVLLLVRSLDRERFLTTVLFYGPNAYVEEFEKAGAEVRILDHQPSSGNPPRATGQPPHERRHRLPDLTLLQPARRLSGLVRRDWPRARQIARVIQETEANLVQCNICPAADRATILAALLAGVPQVCYAQSFTSTDAWIDRQLALRVDRYLCISEAVRRQLRQEAGVPKSRMSVVHAPFEFPFETFHHGNRDIRAGLGANGRHVLIANVGRIIPWKGQDVFLRAFAQIAHRFPEARAVIVGSAGDKPQGQAFEKELHRLAMELRIEDRVVFAGHRDDVEVVMGASDIVVHSSSKPEPLGRVIMEAIALGRPVIATNGGGVPEMIEDGVTGSLASPGDAEDLSRALGTVLTDPERAAEMAERARSEARSRFTAESFARTLEREYEALLLA